VNSVSLGPRGRASSLRGRRQECEILDGLVRAARSGDSSALVVRGEPGIGKSALLASLAGAAGCRVVRAAGVSSQTELAYAGLHQLCLPLRSELDRLPGPQADALGTAFGLRSGGPPDPTRLGLAVLSLLTEGAREQPLICLVDDAQWLDPASVHALSFVARRLAAESVVLVVAVRPGPADQDWSELAQLTVRDLPDAAAEALLDSVLTVPVDPRVRDRILAETRGNPLALVELPRMFAAAELAFGPQPGGARTPAGRRAEELRRQFERLPDQCRLLLTTAAADPLGDLALLGRAAERLGLDLDAALPAAAAGLIELRDPVRFRHPLARSVAYRSATAPDRHLAHRALAGATDAVRDPERRAWHRGHAATGPDEAVAAELDHAAGRALATGGLPAAAAFLELAAILTADTAVRVRRRLDAAQAMMDDAAGDLLAVTEHEVRTEAQAARIDMLRARIGLATGRGDEALPLLLAAARRLEPLEPELALDCYLEAFTAALFTPGGAAREVARAARRAPRPARPRHGDLLLDAMAVRYADGYPAAAPLLRRAVQALDGVEPSLEVGLRVLPPAAVVAADLWDERAWDRLTRRHLRIVRDAGALSALPTALAARAFVELHTGNLGTAAELVEEIEGPPATYAAVAVAAFRGRDDPATRVPEAAAGGEGIGVTLARWAQAMLYNGLGHYPEACRRAAALSEAKTLGAWGLVELIEAAVRAGEPATAADAFARLSVLTRAGGTEWALGVAARSEAQLLDGQQAEDRYQEAVERLRRTGVRTELARARLLYGEWLRRAGRRVEARHQLRTAHYSLTRMGMAAFAERARRELAATGETVRKRTDDTRHDLTAQELHIARLAVEGFTNPEIGSELFISPRTVEWHLRKVFAKLGISARGQLRTALGATRPR
jgi:DNA-binding CsgD family transcriptional regulator